MEKALFVGLDVGGTTMKAAVIDEEGKAFPSVSSDTEASKGAEHGLATMLQTIRNAVETAGKMMEDISAIGVATPGPMDIPAGLLLEPTNMKLWRNMPVRQLIHDHFQLPTAFQNDANAAALGEYWIGAGKGSQSMVMFTLGTGIGGGIILHDCVLEGRHSHGGELGHTKIETSHPRPCECGSQGCLEAYASATSVVKRYREAKPDANDANLTCRGVFEKADRGDATAKKIVEETAYYLALAAANLMHTIDPDMIVFGGGMIAAGEPFLTRIRSYIGELAFPVPAARIEVRFALLGSDAGFIGAAGCARQLWIKGRESNSRWR